MIAWHCEIGGDFLQNQLPETRLANVPPPDTFIVTQNPRLQLWWVGDDPDGFVVAFRYRWTFTIAGETLIKPWTYILNVVLPPPNPQVALIMLGDEKVAPAVRKYFATLPPEGMPKDLSDALRRGDTISVAGVGVFASNSDSVYIPALQLRLPRRFPVHESPNSGTFIFDSNDPITPHTFQIAAIDNLGEVDPIPAEVSFATPRVSPPTTQILTFQNRALPQFETVINETVLVIDHQTETFHGVRFTFKGFDPNSRTKEYQWVVDKDLWPQDNIPWTPFSPSEVAEVTAAHFHPSNKYGNVHTFHVRTLNEFGSIDTTGFFLKPTNPEFPEQGYDTVFAYRTFYTIYPPFARTDTTFIPRALLIQYSFGETSPTPWYPSNQMVEDYYQQILDALGKNGKYDIWRVREDPQATPNFPGLGVIGNYNLVFYISDAVHSISSVGRKSPTLTGADQKILRDYCYIGGKLMISGWALANAIIVPSAEQFFKDLPHLGCLQSPDPCLLIESPNPQPSAGDFVAASGDAALGYQDITLDPNKLDPQWMGTLSQVFIGRQAGFAEIIYRFDSKTDNPRFEDPATRYKGIGTRYLGPTFKCVYFGMPLYYGKQSEVQAAIQKALQDLGE
ncbi:MAG: hypothetical protein HY707_03170 [Ignavibacteriae bacterium]|nr:hypothetical protein [Ignavibacteriota bacterium]